MNKTESLVFYSLLRIHQHLQTGTAYSSHSAAQAWREQTLLADMLNSSYYDHDAVLDGVNKASEMCSGYEHGSSRWCCDCGEELPAEFVPAMDNEESYFRFGSCPFCDSAEGRDLDIEEGF